MSKAVKSEDVEVVDPDASLSSQELLEKARAASGVSHLQVGPDEEIRLMALREKALEREASE
jgi:hypothetical protein